MLEERQWKRRHRGSARRRLETALPIVAVLGLLSNAAAALAQDDSAAESAGLEAPAAAVGPGTGTASSLVPADVPSSASGEQAPGAADPAGQAPVAESVQARDDEALPAASVQDGTRRDHWYGLPMIFMDAGYLGIIGIGVATDNFDVITLGVVGGVVGGMVVHCAVNLTPERWAIGLGKGLLSVLARGGLAGTLCAVGSGCSELSDRALLRTSIGIALGAALDIAFIAYKPVERSNAALGISPMLSHRTLGASLGGRF